jgi:hypothetical protein
MLGKYASFIGEIFLCNVKLQQGSIEESFLLFSLIAIENDLSKYEVMSDTFNVTATVFTL